MFFDLEQEKIKLGIANFGLDLTTMDDVFLKIGEMQENEDLDNVETSAEVSRFKNIKLSTILKII